MIELIILATVIWIGWLDYKKADEYNESKPVFQLKSKFRLTYEKLPEDEVFVAIPKV